MKKTILWVVLLFLATNMVQAKVISQWRGPERTGVYAATGLLKQWPASGPKMLWNNQDIGHGHASPAVTSNRIYVNGEKNGMAAMYAFDMNGKLLWKTIYGPEFTESYPGCRSIPTVTDDNLIYVTTGLGSIYCLNAKDGQVRWSLDFFKKFNGENLRWGFAESPLVYGNTVIVTPGGSKGLLVALDRHTGVTQWTCTDLNELSAYCSPVLVTHNGQQLILTMTQKHIVCVDPGSGKLLWSNPSETRYDIQPNTPWYQDGYVLYSTGYGVGSTLLKLSPDGKSVEQVWHNEDLDVHIHGFIVTGGSIYGAGMKRNRWYCLDWKTGTTQWESRDLSAKGNVVMADGLLYCYTERGEFALVKPDPKAMDVISEFEIILGTVQHWAHPVIKDGRLYVRHGTALMVYNIAK